MLIEPPPYADPDRLVMLWEHNLPRSNNRNVVNPGNFAAWRERAQSFDAMALMFGWTASLTGEGEPARLQAGVGTGNLFEVLGVEALRGRVFGPADAEEGAEDVIVVSDTFWRTKLGGDPDVVGRTILLNEGQQTIVGVISSVVQLPDDVDLWVPFRITQRHRETRGRWCQAVARLAPGVTRDQAQAEMETIAAQLTEERPDFDTGWSVNVVGLRDDLVRDVRAPLLTLLGAVGFVLLIACANVANLMLAHGARRRRELAIRVALGAGRWTILRQVLTESILLAAIGGGVGLLVGVWCMDLLTGLAGDALPGLERIALDGNVLFFTVGLALLTGLLFGIAPGLQAARSDLIGTLKSGSRSVFGDRRGTWARNGLIVAQIALSLVLLVGAGLLTNSFRRLTAVDPGFATQQTLTLHVDLSGAKYPEAPQQVQFFADALERIEALPEVRSAVAISFLPHGGPGSATNFHPLDRPEPAAGEFPVADVRSVTPGFFGALEVPLVRGRGFTPADRADAPKRVVVNRSLAETFWPDEDPIGKRIGMSWGDTLEAEIVGVVEDVRLNRLDTASRHTLYWVHSQFPYDFMTLLVRYEGDRAPAAAVRAQIRSLDADLPIPEMRTMATVVSDSVKRERLTTLLLGVFSLLALLLAAVGIYGVISYTTSQRTQEFGVRMALGARGIDVLRNVLGGGLRLAAVGAVLGLVAAVALTRVIGSMLFEVSATDPTTFVVVAIALLAAMLLACFLPARRATRVDPVTALHYE